MKHKSEHFCEINIAMLFVSDEIIVTSIGDIINKRPLTGTLKYF